MKKYNIPINIARTDDGFLLEAKVPGEKILLHRATKDELLTTLNDKLSATIDELEASG